MEREIDTVRLRRDLEDIYGTAMFGASPMAVMELSKVGQASDEELVEIAVRAGLDIRRYGA